jgi:SNF2 family DNA or RNA helicase
MNSHNQRNATNEFDIEVEELTEEHPRQLTPANVNITLKPHQQTLLARCIEYENLPIKLSQFSNLAPYTDPEDYFQTNMGVIGDRVGSGKSYVILALLVSNDITIRNNTIVNSHGFNKVVYYLHDNARSIPLNMLVVPHNLINQWDYYIRTFGGNLKTKIIKNQKAMDLLEEDCLHAEEGEETASTSTNRTTVINKRVSERLAQYNLIIVTSTIYNRFAYFLTTHRVKLQRAIYDEIDNLNVPGCKHIDANFIWFITASYGNVLYPKGHNKYEASIGRYVWYSSGIKHSGFLKNLLVDLHYNVSRNMMKVLIIKNSEAYVESSLSLPEINTAYILCRTPHEIHVLNGVVDRNIMNHLNADDIQGALAYLSSSQKSTEVNIISRVIQKYTNQMSNIRLQINMTQEYHFDNENDRRNEIQRLEKQMETINKKVELITERIKENNLCTICYDTAITKTLTSCCQNTFCFKCINMWLAQRHVCPLCKINMNICDLFVIDETSAQEDEQQEEYIDPSKTNSKNDKYQNLELILSQLKEQPTSKILIFAAYDNTFMNVVPVLQRLHISYEYVKGNSNQIKCIIERYKEGNTQVLLMNTQHFGSGLNLENTTDMILFHKFDTENEKQVIGRAQRYGRKDPLNVHYLLYENEMPAHIEQQRTPN